MQYVAISGLVMFITGFVTFPHKAPLKSKVSVTSFEIISNSPNHQLFYIFDQSNFSEENSIRFNGSRVEMPDITKLNSLRIDAFLHNGDIWGIELIKISNGNAELIINGEDLLKVIGMKSEHLTQPVLRDGSIVEISVLGDDPYFTMVFDFPLSQFDQKCALHKTNREIDIKQWKNSLITLCLIVLLALGCALRKLWIKHDEKQLSASIWELFSHSVYVCFMIVLVVYIIASLAVNTYNPFIYFRF